MFRDIKDYFSYLQYMSNWHKIQLISKIMCKLGRHDYEAHHIEGNWVVLECFYCEHPCKSHVMHPSKNTDLMDV